MKENLPVLLLRKLILLPYQELRIELNVDLSKKIMDMSEQFYNNKLLVICPENTLEVSPSEADLPTVGILTKIKSKIILPNGNYRVILSGLNRVLINSYRNHADDPDILESTVKRIYIDESNENEEEAILRTLKALVEKYMSVNPAASNSVNNTISNMTDLDMLTDVVANYLPFDAKKKVQYMNEFDYIARANNLIKDINLELEVISIESKIDEEIRESFEKEQRDLILKQKVAKLNEELGINADKQTEVSLYRNKIEKLDINSKIKDKLLDEVKKYAYTSEYSPDSSVIRNYLDTIIDLPWNTFSKDEPDIQKIKDTLDKNHYGLESVKVRILEYIAIKKKSNNVNAPILCLVGPPGVGKTTLGMSISASLNKEFYKISVGGLNDATELTGHKRTYLGSSPGKIIQGIKKCGTSNPVILIDEVDKIVSDFKGDPSAVLLDILDPNQNKAFIDNYIEEPFDLSKVLFVLTANDVLNIPAALKDRLEIIEINSYTEFEKIDIAKRYIIPSIQDEYLISKYKISDNDILKIINNYTKESGVRELRRILEKIFRNITINEIKTKNIKWNTIENILGPQKYQNNINLVNYPGSVCALGVSPYGGVLIHFESIFLPGPSGVIVTGNIEESVKESANISFSYCLSKAKDFKLDVERMNGNSIHINALNYGIKKDGTSGGIAITTAIISLLLNKVVDPYTCFTGEITLHGDVSKVGGVKEKIIGAFNSGYNRVFIPSDNAIDLISVPNEIKDSIEIIPVKNYQEIFNILFKKHK